MCEGTAAERLKNINTRFASAVSSAKSRGATRAELAETLSVCVEMGGGPSSVYAGHALAVYDEIS